MRTSWIMLGILLLTPRGVWAGDLAAKAELGYQSYEYDELSTAGFRQTYDLDLRQTLGTATTLRVFARADDFSGKSGLGDLESRSESLQIKPGAELTIRGEKLLFSARSELQKTGRGLDDLRNGQNIAFTRGRLEWRPDRLPVFNAIFDRRVTENEILRVDLEEENAGVGATYESRGLALSADVRNLQTVDRVEGYDRAQSIGKVAVGYGKALLDDRLSFMVSGTARRSDIREEGLGGTAPSIPTPVTIFRASNGIDDSPSDNRDRPLTPNPALIDRDLSTSAGISVGPDGQSFNNIALELGRLERLDEIRVIVRDELGNPLQIGGGAVQWDVWTSEDGEIWTQVAGVTTSFNRPLSLYSLRFEQLTKRWIKVVNFGVNVGATLVTEVEAYYFEEISPGASRQRAQTEYFGGLSVLSSPTKSLSLSYSGTFNSSSNESTDLPDYSTTAIDHFAAARYSFRKPFVIRGQFSSRDSSEAEGFDTSNSSWSGFVDWNPTDRIGLSAELTRQSQTVSGETFVLETRRLVANTYVVPAFSVALDAGTRSETPDGRAGSGKATFLTLRSDARLTRAVRLSLSASLQRVDLSEGYDPRFLGAARDDRLSANLRWSPGQRFSIDASAGWFRGETREGTIGRLRVQWFPFGDGTIVVGGAVDQDIDTASDRETARAMFQARWAINRYSSFEVNYTAVLTTLESATRDQRTLFATLTLTN